MESRDFEDENPFAGLMLAEPSSSVDRHILEFARARREERRAARRCAFGLRTRTAAAVAAALVALGTTAWLLFVQDHPRSDGALPAPAVRLSVQTDLHNAVGQLREEIEQIDEMTELIPADLSEEREEITTRLRACFARLEKLEAELGMGTPSSFRYPIPGKEINV